MSQFDYDCIVIGGSANGAQAAFSASKSGLKVAVIEEHSKIGLPEHCSGLFSYWGLEKLDCLPPKEIVLNPDVSGSRIISPNGKILTVNKSKRHALVCDRGAFDRFLLEKATNSGVDLYLPFKATQVKKNEKSIEIGIKSNTEQMWLEAPMVISAEGIRASITHQVGLQGPKQDKIINAAQFYMYDLQDIDKTLVELYQTKKFAPDFFAWLIPMSDNSAKIGLGTSRKSAAKELELMIKEHPVLRQKCEGSEIRRKTAGRIPTSGPVKRTFTNNFLMTGDVAGQTKPTTGGGVILGGIAAQIAGRVAAEAINSNNTSSRFLSKYQKLWKNEMYWNLRLMRIVRNYMDQLKDEEITSFFQRLEDKGILQDIEEYGHVDNQGTLVKKFMRTLSLYPFYLKTSYRLFKSVIRS
ncbi:MAG: Digeranylgeranylglycerophospholipid reductase [Candidatus Heimdallarchaeota archaeon LC_2]|nr:MAG: Digeranylgeranylglycerophospholipid reductase [Candidatus Heimdallarchaeota archaeon LC_2]